MEPVKEQIKSLSTQNPASRYKTQTSGLVMPCQDAAHTGDAVILCRVHHVSCHVQQFIHQDVNQIVACRTYPSILGKPYLSEPILQTLRVIVLHLRLPSPAPAKQVKRFLEFFYLPVMSVVSAYERIPKLVIRQGVALLTVTLVARKHQVPRIIIIYVRPWDHVVYIDESRL